MTERATLEALLARVLEGEGPDRELDAEIARMQLPPDADAVTRSRHGWSYRVFGPDGWDDEWLENKPYTASLDAALTVFFGNPPPLIPSKPRLVLREALRERMEAQPLSNP